MKKFLKFLWIAYAIFSILLVVFLADRLITKDLDTASDRILLEKNWTVHINNTQYNNVDLNSFRFPAVQKGDLVTMIKTLPDNLSYGQPTLSLHIRQSATNIYINDELIYEYGHDRQELGKTIGSGIEFINFSNDYAGQELKIIFEVSESRAFSSLDIPSISECKNAYRFVIMENRLPLFIGVFLIVLGVVVTTISIFAVTISRKYMNILSLSMFSICMGLWTLCYHNIVIIFPMPLYSVSLLEYMALLLSPLPIMLYMNTYVKQLQSKRLLLHYRILFIIQLAFSVFAIFLHTIDLVHAAGLLMYFLILISIHILFFTYILRKSLANSKLGKGLYYIGMIIVVVCIVYDLLTYVLNRYVGYQIFKIKGMASIGIMLFLIMLILDLYIDATTKMMEEQEKAILIKQAYTDDLTQINNRHFCSEHMNKLQANVDSKYSIITFDLNNLKKINDNFGHVTGDLLIKTAANAISTIFSPSGIVGRMGGDEFIAILDTNDTKQIESLIKSFNLFIENTNKTDNNNLYLSVSYGYATCDEVTERNIEKVYHLADSRMYVHKKNYKAGKQA